MSVEETVTVSLGACRNLRSTRGDTFTIFGQVGLGKSTILGESSRVEYKATGGSTPTIINLEAKHVVKVSDPSSLDELVRNPLIVSVFEVLPKDKKAREEKTQLLGVATLDLLPLLQGQTRIEQILKLQPVTVTPPSNEDLAEVDLTVSLARSPLLTPEDIAKSNILSLRVKGLYSLPDGWTPNQHVTFVVATPRPRCTDDDIPIGLMITGGEIKGAGEVDLAQSMRRWKWADLSPSISGLSSLTDHALEANAIEDESGQLTSQEDINFRRLAESRKPRVVWNSEIRCFLNSISNTSFLSALSNAPVWPVEVVRITSASAGRGKGKEEETIVSHHGVAYINLSSLLYPGVTRVFGAYCVENMNEAVMAEKTNDIHTRNVMELTHKSVASRKSAKRPSTATRASVISIASQAEQVGSADSAAKAEGLVYSDAKSYILVEIDLDQPLVPKRPASVIAEKISEYIVPHPPVPRRVSGVEKAIKDFHASTTDVAGLLLSDYRSLFGSILEEKGELPSTQEDFEERKRQLIYSLNTTGHYHAYKEHVKKSVIALVRERFLNEANTKDEAEMHAFLSRLYTYLVDEMHSALGKVFSLEDSSPVAPTVVDCDMLRQYANEAESMLDLDMAEYYHKELLSREEHIALHWYEYAVFFLLKGDTANSEQCLKRAVALDQQFVPALLLYGMCCSLDEKFPEAEEMMELATTIDSNNLVAWTIKGLCYELSNNALYRDMCFQEAQKLASSDRDKTYITPVPPKQERQSSREQLDTAGGVASQSLSQEKEAEPTTDATEPVPTAVTETGPVAGTERVEPTDNQDDEVKDDQQRTTVEDIKTADTHQQQYTSPFLQTAAYLLDVHAAKYAEMCLAHEQVLQSHEEKSADTVTEPVGSCSVNYYMAIARLNMLGRQYEEAEKHLSQAVKKDVLCPNSLALLGHCCYLSGKLDIAKDCYERVVEYSTPPAQIIAVLLRLGDIYMTHKEFLKSKQTYLRACRRAASSVTWKGVGIACYMLKDYSEAEDALSEANILNNLDPVVWAYLALVCFHTGRNQEAMQAVNFAIKTGLKESSLVEQLKQIPCE